MYQAKNTIKLNETVENILVKVLSLWCLPAIRKPSVQLKRIAAPENNILSLANFVSYRAKFFKWKKFESLSNIS